MVGTIQIYAGKLAPYVGRRCRVECKYTRGLCKGRYQVTFLEPVYDVDGVELDSSLTVAQSDLACL